EAAAGGEMLHAAGERVERGASLAAQLQDEGLAGRQFGRLCRGGAFPRFARPLPSCTLIFHRATMPTLGDRGGASPERLPTFSRHLREGARGDRWMKRRRWPRGGGSLSATIGWTSPPSGYGGETARSPSGRSRGMCCATSSSALASWSPRT